MLHQLIVLSSGSRFDFSNSNYNYDYSNTNVSSHLSFHRSMDPAHMAKNHDSEKSVGTDGKTIF
jgi:hypothetical protein